jgi:hypothetical protein
MTASRDNPAERRVLFFDGLVEAQDSALRSVNFNRECESHEVPSA